MLRPLAFAMAVLAAAPLAAQDVPRHTSGPYLAGRSAQFHDDFPAVARYLSRALQRDGQNQALMESLTGAYLSLGRWEAARAVADRQSQTGTDSQVSALVRLTGMGAQEEWDALLEALDDGESVGPLFDGLARGWAEVGRGDADAALAAFDAVGESGGVRGYGIYHKALALASLGRFDEAREALASERGLRLTRRGLRAQAQILSRAGDNDGALAVLEDAAGQLDLSSEADLERLRAGETLDFDIAPDARAGLAEVTYDIANAVSGETAPAYALLYVQAARQLRPLHLEATLLAATLFEDMDQFDLAIRAFGEVPATSPAYLMAQLGEAEALRASGQPEQAIDVMRDLAEQRPDAVLVHSTLGDALRDMERWEEARAAYDRAIDLMDEGDRQWLAHFARAITAERLGDWDAAEADFRTALDLNPDQPQVLNYLGYSLVERQEKLDEALSMIERAVEARPDSGYIVDSLGWVLFRLGRYEEAVAPMERAVELVPTDPVLNDHLGDVLWSVGRKLEARFQWQRALSFIDDSDTQDIDPDRVRRKLEVGLDQVLEEEEGADAQAASNEG